MEIHCFMGKGGVGKTTLSVEFARAAQVLGRSACVIGLDQQHNAADVIAAKKYDIPYFGLHSFDNMTAMVRYIVDHTILKHYREFVPVIAGDFVCVAALAELLCDEGRQFDVVAIDFPPNHAAIGMMQLPSVLDTFVFKAATLKNRVRRLFTGKDPALDNIEYLSKTLNLFKEHLYSASFHPVALPEQLAIWELGKLVEALSEWSFNVPSVILNRYPRDACECAPCHARAMRAKEYFGELMPKSASWHAPVVRVYENDFSGLGLLLGDVWHGRKS